MEIVRFLLEYAIVLFVITRISRFGAEDILAEPFRQWVAKKQGLRRDGQPRLLTRGVHCRWCWSVWAAVPVCVVWWLASPTPHLWDRWYLDLPGMILSMSQAAALVQAREPED